MNWRFKAAAQTILSFLPFGEDVNFFLQQKTGSMSEKKIEESIRYGLTISEMLEKNGKSLKDSVVFEIGTGWQPVLPILFSLLGARQVISVDKCRHLRKEVVNETISTIENLLDTMIPIRIYLAENVQNNINTNGGVNEILQDFNIEYRAPCDAAKTGLEDNSIDCCFSLSVLEHIPEKELDSIIIEVYRILKPGGSMCHIIGLFDHYVSFDTSISAVNFLKYSDFTWNICNLNRFNYMNRLRFSQYCKKFTDAGFEMIETRAHPDENCLETLKSMHISHKYRKFDINDLATIHAEIAMQKPV